MIPASLNTAGGFLPTEVGFLPTFFPYLSPARSSFFRFFLFALVILYFFFFFFFIPYVYLYSL